MEEVKHIQGPNPEPYRVEVERGQKGDYGLSIRMIGADPLKVVEQVKAIDTQLRKEFMET
jgi:hypothetical protein